MACLFDLNGCDWFIWVITGKPPAFNICPLLLTQNLSLLMHKCKANVLEIDSASGRLSHGTQHIFWFSSWWGRGYRIRHLLSSHAAICASSYQGNWFEAKFWGLCPIKTLLNIPGHKISSDLEDGAFSAYCSAVKPPAHNQEISTSVLFFQRKI